MKKLILFALTAFASLQAFACPGVDKLVSTYKISPIGIQGKISVTSAPDLTALKLIPVYLPLSQMVYDGFGYTAYLDPATKKAWIQESGGFVHQVHWYGPIDTSEFSLEQCAPKPQDKPSIQVPALPAMPKTST